VSEYSLTLSLSLSLLFSAARPSNQRQPLARRTSDLPTHLVLDARAMQRVLHITKGSRLQRYRKLEDAPTAQKRPVREASDYHRRASSSGACPRAYPWSYPWSYPRAYPRALRTYPRLHGVWTVEEKEERVRTQPGIQVIYLRAGEREAAGGGAMTKGIKKGRGAAG
jgi:hypothetical protein